MKNPLLCLTLMLLLSTFSDIKAQMPINPVKSASAHSRVSSSKTYHSPTALSSKTTVSTAVKPPVSSPRIAKIEFDTVSIDLGTIKEDAIIERLFSFTNTGNESLMVTEVRGSCGCVQPSAPLESIAPGQKGSIYVKYVAKNKVGPQKAVVTITTNGYPTTSHLIIESWVEQIPGGVKDN